MACWEGGGGAQSRRHPSTPARGRRGEAGKEAAAGSSNDGGRGSGADVNGSGSPTLGLGALVSDFFFWGGGGGGDRACTVARRGAEEAKRLARRRPSGTRAGGRRGAGRGEHGGSGPPMAR